VAVYYAQVSEVVLFAGAHARFFGGVIDVVVAAKVEDAVREEVGELSREGVTNSCCLARGSRKRDGDVPEEPVFREPLDEVVGLIREGKDIRRFVYPEELVVHLADLVVTDDEDGETGPCFDVLAGHHPHGEIAQRIAIERGSLYHDFEGDVVRQVVVHRGG